MCILDNHLEGAVSQIFDLGPSFYFMKSRKINKKLPVFHHKIRTEKLSHHSLQMNVMNACLKS